MHPEKSIFLAVLPWSASKEARLKAPEADADCLWFSSFD
jgi:hypothetical protein